MAVKMHRFIAALLLVFCLCAHGEQADSQRQQQQQQQQQQVGGHRPRSPKAEAEIRREIEQSRIQFEDERRLSRDFERLLRSERHKKRQEQQQQEQESRSGNPADAGPMPRAAALPSGGVTPAGRYYDDTTMTPWNTACTGNRPEELEEFSANFTSPNFPGYYPSYSYCEWRITSQLEPQQQGIYMEFRDFYLDRYDCVYIGPYIESSTDTTTRQTTRHPVSDYYTSEFPSSSGDYLAFCYYDSPGNIYLPYSDVNVTFTSDYYYASYGFRALYTSESACSVGRELSPTTSGNFSSPFYPWETAQAYTYCDWFYTGLHGKELIVTFSYFYFGGSCNLNEGYLQICHFWGCTDYYDCNYPYWPLYLTGDIQFFYRSGSYTPRSSAGFSAYYQLAPTTGETTEAWTTESTERLTTERESTTEAGRTTTEYVRTTEAKMSTWQQTSEERVPTTQTTTTQKYTTEEHTTVGIITTTSPTTTTVATKTTATTTVLTTTANTIPSTTTSSAPNIYPEPYVTMTLNGTVFASYAIDSSCLSSFTNEFRNSFNQIISRANDAIVGGQLCVGISGLSSVAGSVQFVAQGAEGRVTFAVLVGVPPSDVANIRSVELCSYDVTSYVQTFSNWRQPIISNIYNCPTVTFNPETFSLKSAQWSCF